MSLLIGLALGLMFQQAAAPPAAHLRGRVFDADGQPFGGVEIVAYVLVDDRERAIGPARLTHVDGAFEMSGLPPGPVYLRAVPRMTRVRFTAAAGASRRPVVGHPPVYYPGVLDRVEAWPIDLAAGETVELDFHVPPIMTASIKATIAGPEGYGIDQARVIRPASNSIRTVRVSDGAAVVEGLREGRHAVVVRGHAGDTTLAAFQIVDLEAGEVEVALQLQPTATVIGRIFADRGETPPLAGVRVTAAWTHDGADLDPLPSDHADAGADGAFQFDALFGTRTFRVGGLPEDWYVYAVRLGASDITASGTDLPPGSSSEIAIVLKKR